MPTTRVLAMPADTNAAGDIFGGWIMSQVDIAASIAASHTPRTPPCISCAHDPTLRALVPLPGWIVHSTNGMCMQLEPKRVAAAILPLCALGLAEGVQLFLGRVPVALLITRDWIWAVEVVPCVLRLHVCTPTVFGSAFAVGLASKGACL